eukprot:GFUD01022320.1.p1 GENE.GFUD01022320.1~~GFUD01022320.1.p1  ORF type:complete len:280 (+),score=121.79 GFUD01022320.1:124-963(+)
MAFRMLRNKRNARWNQKLQELFQEKDKNQSGSISLEQMSDIFRIYKVELNIAHVESLLDPNGQIKKNDLIDYCIEAKLMDLTDITKDRKKAKEDKVKEKEDKLRETKENKNEAKKGTLFGFLKKNSFCQEKKKEAKMDRVEAAFNKLDKDGDGYIDWEEFKQVAQNTVDVEKAGRIFSACDQSGDKKISLEEFRTMANIKKEEVMESERKLQNDLDKVEAAFRKLDKDGDGFIDWNEFKEVSKDLDTKEAKNIFDACDKSGDNKISLQEFRCMASMKVE